MKTKFFFSSFASGGLLLHSPKSKQNAWQNKASHQLAPAPHFAGSPALIMPALDLNIRALKLIRISENPLKNFDPGGDSSYPRVTT